MLLLALRLPLAWAVTPSSSGTSDSTTMPVSSAAKGEETPLETVTLEEVPPVEHQENGDLQENRPGGDQKKARPLNVAPLRPLGPRHPARRAPKHASGLASSQPLLSLTATKIVVPEEQVGSSVTIITREQIRRMQPASLLDVLQGVPGVDVTRHGALGQPTSIFLRGMNAEHTLVLVDGVRLNDPLSAGRSFDWLDQISPDAVERIEILRGPQGPLYGSDGMGGVVHIITRRGSEESEWYGQVSGGSYGNFRQDYGIGGRLGERLRGAAHFFRQDIQGFSNAGSRYGNEERDGFHNSMLTGRVEATPLRNWTLDLSSLYSKARSDLDNGGGLGQDDPNYTGETRLFTLSAGSRLRLMRDRFEPILRMTLTDIARDTWNSRDANHPYDSELSRYRGKLLTLEAQHNVYTHPSNTLTLGFHAQQEWGRSDNRFTGFFLGPYTLTSDLSDRSLTSLGFYAQDHIRIRSRWFTTLGIRHDRYDRFGGATTCHAASTYIIRKTGTRLKASFGSGFKAPTIYQLYSVYGDPQLMPETGVGWDAGIEQAFHDDRVRMGVTVFQNQTRNLIQFSPASRYENIARARTQGIESFLSVRPFRNVHIQANYTYTDARNLSDGALDGGKPLLRRPRNKFSLNIHYQPHRRVSLNLDITHIGQRDDQDFSRYPATRVRLGGFTLVNLTAGVDLPHHVTVFARLANLLDTPYEWVKGYGAPRFSAYGGLRVAL